MRAFLALFFAVFAACSSAPAYAQGSCIGLACQQTTCPGGGTTSVTGTVYAPNATDPLPNVLVFVPNVPNTPNALPPFSAGVLCVPPSTAPGGSPLVGTISDANGNFIVSNVPVGVDFPLVIQAGRWRRKITVSAVTACSSTSIPAGTLSFPTVQTAGDTDDNIPLIAVATGNIDPAECVLRKVGIADSQFSDPGGSGRVQFFLGGRSAGAKIDGATPPEDSLVGTTDPTLNPTGAEALNNYDMVMFPCQGGVSTATSNAAYSNLRSYVNAGGRVFATHWSEGWLNDNSSPSTAATVTSPFQGIATWVPAADVPGPFSDIGDINTTGFSDGLTLAQWLMLVAPSTTLGQIGLQNVFSNVSAVSSSANEWIAEGSPSGPVAQFSFDTPLGAPAAQQCGRVLYNDYHVETQSTSGNSTFPNECTSTGMTPQEKVLEYSLFALTAEGNSATLTPTTQNFTSEFVTFSSPAQTFTWTNQAVFPATVTLLTTSGDFFIVPGNNCTNVAPQGSCQITVIFTPSDVGPRTGTLTVGAPGSTLTAALTGTGLSPFSVSTATMNFPGVIIGATLSQTLNLMNISSASFPLPTFTTQGDYTDTTGCTNPMPANSSCIITVIFAPTALGLRNGTLTVNAPGNPLAVALTGTGLPNFTVSAANVTFANVDVGGSASQSIILSNVAPVAFPLPTLSITGDYSTTTTNCPSTVPANTSCLINVIFAPTATGIRTGTLTVTYGAGTLPVTLAGNGVDFSLALNPNSGGIIAGYSIATTLTATPIAGFAAPITLSCATAAAASQCVIPNAPFMLDAVTSATIDITTTSQYTVVGYGMSGSGWLWLLALGSGLLLWTARKGAARFGVLVILLVGAFSLNGCSGKLPGVNSSFTAPGSTTYTLTATDGTITHSVTYTLNVSAK